MPVLNVYVGNVQINASSLVLNATDWSILRSSNFTQLGNNGVSPLLANIRFYSIGIENRSGFALKVALDSSTSATPPTVASLNPAQCIDVKPFDTLNLELANALGSAGVRRILYLVNVDALDPSYFTALNTVLNITASFYPS
jgi:hypothetical protein